MRKIIVLITVAVLIAASVTYLLLRQDLSLNHDTASSDITDSIEENDPQKVDEEKTSVRTFNLSNPLGSKFTIDLEIPKAFKEEVSERKLMLTDGEIIMGLEVLTEGALVNYSSNIEVEKVKLDNYSKEVFRFKDYSYSNREHFIYFDYYSQNCLDSPACGNHFIEVNGVGQPLTIGVYCDISQDRMVGICDKIIDSIQIDYSK